MHAAVRNRVPQIVLIYWVIKIASTTLGETGADMVSMTFKFGYATTLLVFLAGFLVFLGIKLAIRRYDAVLYWLVFTASAIAGTAISDFIDRTLGLGYAAGSGILVLLLLGVLALWKAKEKTISVENITTAPAEGFYWIAFLIANTLGTAAGDFLADDAGLGFLASAGLISAILLVVMILHFHDEALAGRALLGRLRAHAALRGDVWRFSHEAGRPRRVEPRHDRRIGRIRRLACPRRRERGAARAGAAEGGGVTIRPRRKLRNRQAFVVLPRSGVFPPIRSFLTRVVFGGLAVASLLPTAGSAEAPQFTEAKKPASVFVPPGVDFKFGYVAVPERHAAPAGSPSIRIAVLVLKARKQPAPSDPVFYFVGGPGGPAMGAVRSPLFLALNAERDLVVADARGCGLSSPNLYFRFPRKSPDARLRANRERFRARGIDLGAYNATEMAQDYESVRVALGYGKINVVAGSFGTFVAQETIRRFGPSLRCIVLSGNLAANNGLITSFLRTTSRGVEAFLADVEGNAAAQRDFPAFRAQFYGLLRELRRQPQKMTLVDDEGGPHQVEITADAMLSAVIGMLTHPATSCEVPLLVSKVARQDPTGIVADTFLPSSPGDPANDSEGAYYSIIATSFGDENFIRDGDRAVRRAANRVIAGIKSADFRAGNRRTIAWGAPYDPGTTRELPTSNVRALLLNGTFDTQTPDTAGAVIARGLPNATNYIYPRIGHGAGFYNGPDKDAVVAFIDDPATPPPYGNTDHLLRPKFYVPSENSSRNP